MKFKIIDTNDGFFVIHFEQFTGEKLFIEFIENNDIDTIQIIPYGINRGFFNDNFKRQAQKEKIWEACLYHEILHCIPSFYVQYYSPMDILPIECSVSIKNLISNIIEDVAINHTLWLWDVNPIRSAGYRYPNITEKLIYYYEKYQINLNIPEEIAAIVECISNIHFENLKWICKERKGKKPKKAVIRLNSKLYGDILKPLSENLNLLLNNQAVSIKIDDRYVKINLKPGPNIKNRPSYEVRYRNKPIPQFVYMKNSIVSNIYDLFDLHFSEAYNIKIDKLRERAYNHYKKEIEKRKVSVNSEKKGLILNFRNRTIRNKIIIDIHLRSNNSNIRNYKPSNNVKFDNISQSWERNSRYKKSELYRLKKWIN